MLTAAGVLVTVEWLDWATQTGGVAYNLTVAALHTYFVMAGYDLVLLHNRCGHSSEENAQRIADGHAFDDHVRNQPGFGPVGDRGDFAYQIQQVLDYSDDVKDLSDGRTAYWMTF